MKILRFIVILLGIVIAGFLVLGLIAPKDITIERSVTINAGDAAVAEQMFHFANFKNWSPFHELDTNMKTEIIGKDGKNATYSWQGNDKAGVGNMVLTSVIHGEMNGRNTHQANIDLNFIKPMEGHAKTIWRVEGTGERQSKATWIYQDRYGYPWNGLMMIVGMKKMMEKEFDKGLNKLKTYIESGKAGSSQVNMYITQTEFAGGNYAAIRKKVAFSEMDDFFGESYEAISKAAESRINGKGVGIYYNWDETNGTADVAAAFPITGNEPVAGIEILSLPASPAYMMLYRGGYAGSYAAHQALTSKLKEDGKEQQLCVEEYVINPGDTNDSNMYVTNIYYLVK